MYFDDKNCIKNVFLVIKKKHKKHKKLGQKKIKKAV